MRASRVRSDRRFQPWAYLRPFVALGPSRSSDMIMPCSAAALACCIRHLLLSTATLSVFLGRPRRRCPAAARGLRSPPVLSLLARLRVALLRQQEQGHAKAKGCALLMSNQGTRPGKQGRAAQTFVSLVRREGRRGSLLARHGMAWQRASRSLFSFDRRHVRCQRLAAWPGMPPSSPYFPYCFSPGEGSWPEASEAETTSGSSRMRDSKRRGCAMSWHGLKRRKP